MQKNIWQGVKNYTNCNILELLNHILEIQMPLDKYMAPYKASKHKLCLKEAWNVKNSINWIISFVKCASAER
jgi:hypothetical protein